MTPSGELRFERLRDAWWTVYNAVMYKRPTRLPSGHLDPGPLRPRFLLRVIRAASRG